LRTLTEVENYLREIYAPFGRLSDAQWRHIAQHSVIERTANNCGSITTQK
jgi:hypothetical protein